MYFTLRRVFGYPEWLCIGDGYGQFGLAEQSVGHGAADRVVPEVNVDWRQPGKRERSPTKTTSFLVELNYLRRFTILDLPVWTAMLAINFAAFPAEARTGGSDWAAIVYLTPTVVTCLIHLRLRLRIPVAAAVHYFFTATWTFLHAVGVNFAINAYNHSGGDPQRSYQLLVYSNALNDTVEMLAWGVILAATYAGVCYTAVSVATATGVVHNDVKVGEPSDAPESPNRAF